MLIDYGNYPREDDDYNMARENYKCYNETEWLKENLNE